MKQVEGGEKEETLEQCTYRDRPEYKYFTVIALLCNTPQRRAILPWYEVKGNQHGWKGQSQTEMLYKIKSLDRSLETRSDVLTNYSCLTSE